MTPSLPKHTEEKLGSNPPADRDLAAEAKRRLDSLKVVTDTTKKTLTTIALLRLVDLDPRDHIDGDLAPQIVALLETNYGSIAPDAEQEAR